MADKPEFVDLISARTQQNWRRPVKRVAEPEAKEERRLSATGRRIAWSSGGWSI